MRSSVTISLDDSIFERARIAASARGMTVEDFLADLIKRLHPPLSEEKKSGPSSTIGKVEETKQK